MAQEKITKDDSTIHVAAKTLNNVVFSKEHTIQGILLIVLGVMVYITITLIEGHFKKFDDFTKKVDLANTIMIKNNDLMETSINLMHKQIEITKENNDFLDRNKRILRETTQEILDNNTKMLKNLKRIENITQGLKDFIQK